jgi:hypothetical protein
VPRVDIAAQTHRKTRKMAKDKTKNATRCKKMRKFTPTPSLCPRKDSKHPLFIALKNAAPFLLPPTQRSFRNAPLLPSQT